MICVVFYFDVFQFLEFFKVFQRIEEFRIIVFVEVEKIIIIEDDIVVIFNVFEDFIEFVKNVFLLVVVVV